MRRHFTKDDWIKLVSQLEGRTLQAVQGRWCWKLKRSFIASIDGGGGDEKSINKDAMDNDATEEDGSGPGASSTKKRGHAAAAASKKEQNKRRQWKRKKKECKYTMQVDEDVDEHVINDHSCLESDLYPNNRIMVRDESIGGGNVPVYATFAGKSKSSDCGGVSYLVKIKGNKMPRWIPERAIQSIFLPKGYNVETGERDEGGGGDMVKGENEGEDASASKGAKLQYYNDYDNERKGRCSRNNRNILMEKEVSAPVRIPIPLSLHHFSSKPSEDRPA